MMKCNIKIKISYFFHKNIEIFKYHILQCNIRIVNNIDIHFVNSKFTPKETMTSQLISIFSIFMLEYSLNIYNSNAVFKNIDII